MFKFLGQMFGSDKAITSIIDNVSSGLDKLSYTDQERARDALKERSEARSMIIRWMESTQGQNLTRRFIAFSFTVIYFLLFLSGVVLSITGIWVEDATRIDVTADLIFKYVQEVSMTYSLIIAFYFAAPHMSSMVNAYTNKKASEIKGETKDGSVKR